MLPVVEACRLDRYDNFYDLTVRRQPGVVEACRLDGYDNIKIVIWSASAYERTRWENASCTSESSIRQDAEKQKKASTRKPEVGQRVEAFKLEVNATEKKAEKAPEEAKDCHSISERIGSF